MPRAARHSSGGLVYHVLNRGGSRRGLFANPKDYELFLGVLADAANEFPKVKLMAFCLMPDHFHLIIRPAKDGELSTYMRWVTQAHTQRWRSTKARTGETWLYASRFRSFVVQEDATHFPLLARFVENNPKRKKLVKKSLDWKYSSATARKSADGKSILSEWPVKRPANHEKQLDAEMEREDLAKIATCIFRGRPLGDEKWTARTVDKYKLAHTVRPLGRPHKKASNSA